MITEKEIDEAIKEYNTIDLNVLWNRIEKFNPIDEYEWEQWTIMYMNYMLREYGYSKYSDPKILTANDYRKILSFSNKHLKDSFQLCSLLELIIKITNKSEGD